MSGPESALHALSEALRTERSVISQHVGAPRADQSPALGLVAAAGSRASAAPGEYALIVEAVREGYLLHYGRPRLFSQEDPDLALLAGDYLYALALERLAKLEDLEAVAELADLISLAAKVHEGNRPPSRAETEAAALWLATAAAIGAGASPEHVQAKEELRSGSPDAPERLWTAAIAAATRGGFGEHVRAAAQAIDFAADFPYSSG